MAKTAQPPLDRKPVEAPLKNVRPDVKDLWLVATLEYKEILGSDAKDLSMRFRNVDAMVKFGDDQITGYSKWRHDDSKLDKIRSLFRDNIDLIGAGTQKLIEAATPAFPPASIIGAALTFAFAGCKSVSADFDMVSAFFEEMNSFLRRVKIIEGNLPREEEYQLCLTEVFTSLLALCAFATKIIKDGRFKKFMVNVFLGEDGDLALARSRLRKSFERLESITLLKILANSEDTHDLQSKLNENSKLHTKLLEDQQEMLRSVSRNQIVAQEDLNIIKQILLEQKAQQETPTTAEPELRNGVKGIKTVIRENLDNLAELNMLRESRLTQSCEWLFKDVDWQDWVSTSEDSTAPPLLILLGAAGVGKSHLAVAAYDHLQNTMNQEANKKTYTACFFCRSGVPTLNSFQDMIGSTILQVSEHAANYEQVNAVLAKDDQIAEQDYLTKLLVPLFEKDTISSLYIIIDAIDELETDQDRILLKEMIDLINTQKLNIKVLVTSRKAQRVSADPMVSFFSLGSDILVDKQKVLHDLESIIADRLGSADSAYRGIRRLKAPVRKEIARRLKEKADGLLYAELALRHLSSIGREGAVMKQLETSLPESAAGFLENDMNQCWRRVPDSRVEAVKLLLAFLTFGFEVPSLDEANTLLQDCSGDQDFFIEDDLDGVYGRIIQVASAFGSTAPDETGESAVEAMSFDDGEFKVMLRDRAMQDFLFAYKPVAGKQRSCLSHSAAHRAIFLICFDLIEERSLILSSQAPSTGQHKLYRYAISHCLRHWRNIDCTEHEPHENTVILEKFAVLLRDRNYLATQIEAMGFDHSIDLITAAHRYDSHESWSRDFSERWVTWSRWVVENMSTRDRLLQTSITSETYEYWSSEGDEILLPLAKAHIDNWLSATEHNQGRKSYYFARKAIAMTTMHQKLYSDLPPESSDDTRRFEEDFDARRRCIEEVYTLRSISTLEVNSNVHWATAALFRDIGFLWIEEFLKEANESKRTCKDYIQQFRSNNLEACYICQPYGTGYGEGRESLKSFLDHREGVPAPDVAEALVLSIGFLTSDKYFEEDREAQSGSLLRDLRDLGATYFLPARMLYRAYKFYCEPNGLRSLNMFTELKRTQRLTLLSFPDLWKCGILLAHAHLVRDVVFNENVDELISFYGEMIEMLDKESSGAVLRRYLAHLYRAVKGDDKAAKAILIEALNDPQPIREFELFRLDAGFVAVETVNMMSDIIYKEFRETVNPTVKSALLGESKALLQQPFPDSVQINTASTIPHLLVNAVMVHKMGSDEEWQACLQHAFDICCANLHDALGWNDPINLRYMSRVLAQVPGLYRDAQIANSAQFYYIGNESPIREFIKSDFTESLWTYRKSYDIHFDGWSAVRPRTLIYARDGKIRWDAKKNEWDFVRELAENENPDICAAVDFDESVEVGEQLGDEWRSHFGRYVIFEDDYYEKRELNPEPLDPIEEELFEDFERYNPGGWAHVQPSTTERHHLPEPQCAGCGKLWVSMHGWRDPMFTCMLCTNSVLCRYCYQDRMAWNTTGQSKRKVSFCCNGGQYLRSPVAKWQGIRYRKMHIEGEEPMDWDDFMQGVKTRWDKAWEEFWRN